MVRRSNQKPRVVETSGFFFGSDSYTWNEEGYAEDNIQENYYYKENDLQFIESAKQALEKKIQSLL